MLVLLRPPPPWVQKQRIFYNNTIYLNFCSKWKYQIFSQRCVYLLYQLPNLPQPHHLTSWDFHSVWSCIEWWSGDRWMVTGDRWHVTRDARRMAHDTHHMTCDIWYLFFSFFSWIVWYWCYYPLTSKDSVSPVCSIFLSFLLWVLGVAPPNY